MRFYGAHICNMLPVQYKQCIDDHVTAWMVRTELLMFCLHERMSMK